MNQIHINFDLVYKYINMNQVKENSFYAWFLAARPKTLTGAVIPVLIGCALAFLHHEFKLIPAVVCLLFAGLMQIAANFINDWYDYTKGSDRDDRLGPKRACAQGWITVSKMKKGIALCLFFACLIGCVLIYYGGVKMVIIGVICVVFAFLYTTVLSYYGVGDLLVIIFFGFAALGGTYYVQALDWTVDTTLLSVSCGLVIETLLLVNNYRDREADIKSHKLTLVVRFGEPFGCYMYLVVGGIASVILLLFLIKGCFFTALLPLIYLLPHYRTWCKMVQIKKGRALNKILGMTSVNILLYGVCVTIGLILDMLLLS